MPLSCDLVGFCGQGQALPKGQKEGSNLLLHAIHIPGTRS